MDPNFSSPSRKLPGWTVGRHVVFSKGGMDVVLQVDAMDKPAKDVRIVASRVQTKYEPFAVEKTDA